MCFGCIYITAKKIDENFYAQRFSSQNPRSGYSQTNKERLVKLVEQGKVIESVRITLEEVLNEKFVIPPDILKEIKANKVALETFNRFSQEYQRIRIAYIDAARKKPYEFKKRLYNFIKITKNGQQFGFGGIEKYC